MIIRVYRATVQPGAHAEYEKTIREKGIPLMRAEPGLVDLYIGTPRDETPDDYAIITIWRDFESMKHFVGESWNKPMVLPAQAHLIKEMVVHHYEVLEP